MSQNSLKSIIQVAMMLCVATVLTTAQAANTDNPKPVVVTNFPAAQSVSGEVSVNNFPASQHINGTVNVGNLPAVQQVEGQVAIANLPAVQNVELRKNLIHGGGNYQIPINSYTEINIPAGIVVTDVSWTPSWSGYTSIYLYFPDGYTVWFAQNTGLSSDSKTFSLASGIRGPLTISLQAQHDFETGTAPATVFWSGYVE